MRLLYYAVALALLAGAPRPTRGERQFFLRVDTVSTKGLKIPAGESAPDQFVLLKVDDISRAEYPSYLTNKRDHLYEWVSNIIDDVATGDALKFWMMDYQRDGEQTVGNTQCWGYQMGCGTALYRELSCQWMYEGYWAAEECRGKSAATCTASLPPAPATPPRYTWGQCLEDSDACDAVRAQMLRSYPKGFCGPHKYQNLGYAKVTLPTQASTWNVSKFGSRTRWGNLTTENVNVEGSVTYRLQFWASQCLKSEFLTEEGFCRSCQPGQRCNGVGQTPCAAGHFSTGGTDRCTACPAGTYQAYEGQPSCVPCEAGTYVDVAGQATCKPCQGGYWGGAPSTQRGAIAKTCSGPCEVGYFCPAGKSTKATENACHSQSEFCPAGSAQPTKVSTGHYAVGAGGGECGASPKSTCQTERRCEAGYYCSAGVRRECVGAAVYCPGGGDAALQCPAGNYTTGTGALQTGCARCPPGSKCDGATAVPCAAGTYALDGGATKCVEAEGCPTNQYLKGSGGASAGTCTECALTTATPKSECSQTTLILCTRLFNQRYPKPLLSDISGCQKCRSNCSAGEYVKGCTGKIEGTCTACAPCPHGKRRVGCSGVRAGTCADRGGLEMAAESLGMSVGVFVFFIVAIVCGALAALCFYGYRKRREHLAAEKKRAEWEGRTIELEGFQDAEKNMSMNPLWADSQDVQGMVKRVKTTAEMNLMIEHLAKENEKLKDEVRRIKIATQKGLGKQGSRSGAAFAKMSRRATTKKEFESQRAGGGRGRTSGGGPAAAATALPQRAMFSFGANNGTQPPPPPPPPRPGV